MLVSFIIIAYNAEKSLPALFESLKCQDYDSKNIEVILIDGKSNDLTKKMMLEFAEKEKEFARVIVKENPKKTLPCGWNVALNVARGTIILRIDAHATMNKNFISKNVENILNGENICGGKVVSISKNETRFEKLLTLGESSMFGGSFSRFRRSNIKAYVDTLAFASYKKEVFDKVGKYDERLTRTEDNEMHYRMRKAGYKFYYDPEIVSYRETRQKLNKLLRQKFLNGYWIGLTMGISPKCFSLYHFIPFMFILGIIVTSLLAVFNMPQLGCLMWGLYLLIAVLMTIMSILQNKDKFDIYYFVLPIIFLLLHLSYGIGTVTGIIYLPIWLHKSSS